MKTEYKFKPGSPSWWVSERIWTRRGIVDSILRLFEQGEITRKKALNLLMLGSNPSDIFRVKNFPRAPWKKLNWKK